MTTDVPTLRERNLALFKEYAPDIHARFGDGDFCGEDTPKQPDFAERITRVRFTVGAPAADKMDRYTFDFLSGVLGRARDAGIATSDWPIRDDAYFLLLIGIRDHAHIAAEIARTRCLCLLILEPDIEALRWSLDHVDWREIFISVHDRGGEVEFIFLEHAADISAGIWRTVRSINPVTVDGMTCVTFGHTELAHAVIERLSGEIGYAYSALGYFYDESLMVWNTYRNLSQGQARIYHRTLKADRSMPAFIVGSGPSLDQDLDVIAANRDRAIVVSCGSALRPLLKRGIVPDFQIETENIAVSPLVVQAAKEFDLTDVVLVASSTVDPDALPAFREVVYFFRYALASYPLFAPSIETTLLLPDPTVGNAGLSFALETGFREIYLFGLDCGSVRAGAHHSGDAFQNSPEGAKYRVASYDIPVEANFDGTCWTETGLLSSRNNLAEAAKLLGRSATIRNCSDGAAIAGIPALRSGEIELPAVADAARRAEVSNLLAAFPGFSGKDQQFQWVGAEFAETIRRYAQVVADEFTAIRSFADKTYQLRLMQLFQPKSGLTVPQKKGLGYTVNTLFRGTLFAMILFMERSLARVTDPARADDLGRIAVERIIAGLRLMEEEAMRMFAGAAPAPPPPLATLRPPPGSKLPKPMEPSRNADCPCGSGRKYKHCHGARNG